MNLWTFPHSGTRFIRRVLDDWGIQWEHRHFKPDEEFRVVAPTIVTLRDPLLCRISFYNRGEDVNLTAYPVTVWETIFGLSDVHFVRIDNPRAVEMRLLAAFCGLDTDHDWKVVEPSKDTTGLRAEYKSGVIPEPLREDAQTLREIGATAFFRRHEYKLPWMEA